MLTYIEQKQQSTPHMGVHSDTTLTNDCVSAGSSAYHGQKQCNMGTTSTHQQLLLKQLYCLCDSPQKFQNYLATILKKMNFTQPQSDQCVRYNERLVTCQR
eukprot:3760121-Amphidinium_carterae.2